MLRRTIRESAQATLNRFSGHLGSVKPSRLLSLTPASASHCIRMATTLPLFGARLIAQLTHYSVRECEPFHIGEYLLRRASRGSHWGLLASTFRPQSPRREKVSPFLSSILQYCATAPPYRQVYATDVGFMHIEIVILPLTNSTHAMSVC